jgi:hypothetical protein
VNHEVSDDLERDNQKRPVCNKELDSLIGVGKLKLLADGTVVLEEE